MRILYIILSFLLLVSCSQSTKNALKEENVPFLWRDSIGDLVINDSLCEKLSAPQKAALAYVATFVGSDCDWDDEGAEHLKCKILSALDLGYQCSDKHLGFLQQWFRADTASLSRLEGCPIVPFTATIQETFVKIDLKTQGNAIAVYFEANGINLRDQENWDWTETDYFVVEDDHIKLTKQDKSPLEKHTFGIE